MKCFVSTFATANLGIISKEIFRYDRNGTRIHCEIDTVYCRCDRKRERETEEGTAGAEGKKEQTRGGSIFDVDEYFKAFEFI